MKKVFNFIAFLFFVASANVCADPVKAYAGEVLSTDEVSIIGCGMGASIKSIDGNKEYRGEKFKCDHYVKPGEHMVRYQLTQASAEVGHGYVHNSEEKTVRFTTEPGHKYILMGVFDEGEWVFRILLRNMSDSILSMDVEHSHME